MSQSKQNIYNGLRMRLQGQGLEALGALQGLFDGPIPDTEAILDAVAEINRCENALTVLQGYIGPQFAPKPAPAPAPPPLPVQPQEVAERSSMVVDEVRSPTFKGAKERREKLMKKKKKKDKSDD